MTHFDLITVGGGLAASTLARSMAESGASVLVLEHETQFKDRVRGEYIPPWGVAEAVQVGIFDILRSSCAHELPSVDLGFGPRDLVATTSHQLPALSFSHSEMQEALLDATASAGADVRRGVTVQGIEPGKVPAVKIKGTGMPERVSARLIVAADGRGSLARKWADFGVKRNDQPFLFAGVFLQDVATTAETAFFIFNPDLGLVVGMVPQAKGRFRAYLGYPSTMPYRLQGKEKLGLFTAESAKAVPTCRECYAQAKCLGPLASFEGGDSWVEHSYKNGVALIGDAAATSDPSFGQGMSLTLRDARVLRDALLNHSDWDTAGHLYAEQHDSYFHTCHSVTVWFRQLFQEQSPEAALRRQRALPLIAENPTRVPDHLFGGPDLPADESVRLRFFGES